ncbi:MAG: transcriptional regulator [Bacteroidetes bacterium]|nr:transcriptional regulator [Bacteroidota bacterium]
MVELRDKGMVISKMGPSGGYLLAKHPEEVMVSHIIRSTGGPIALLPCASLNFYEKCAECTNEDTCGLHDVVMEVREASLKILSKTSLTDLILREKRLERKFMK